MLGLVCGLLFILCCDFGGVCPMFCLVWCLLWCFVGLFYYGGLIPGLLLCLILFTGNFAGLVIGYVSFDFRLCLIIGYLA